MEPSKWLHFLSPQYRSEPMSMASASVVDDVFSKFYKTGLHAQ